MVGLQALAPRCLTKRDKICNVPQGKESDTQLPLSQLAARHYHSRQDTRTQCSSESTNNVCSRRHAIQQQALCFGIQGRPCLETSQPSHILDGRPWSCGCAGNSSQLIVTHLHDVLRHHINGEPSTPDKHSQPGQLQCILLFPG